MDVNGARLAIATICSGTDVKIGNCEIHFAQMFASVPLSVSISPEPNSAIKRNDAWENKSEIIDNVSLSHEGIAAIESFQRPLAAVEHLSSISLLEDAIRLLAGTLPVYSLIQWVFQAFCHHEVGNEACRTETQRWLNEPTEERRLEIANHVPWNETSCPEVTGTPPVVSFRRVDEAAHRRLRAGSGISRNEWAEVVPSPLPVLGRKSCPNRLLLASRSEERARQTDKPRNGSLSFRITFQNLDA